jgi:glycine/D-amino acid oxidase-like deaminating enzyme
MRVAVLGAGLQGACVAMGLAEAGVQVDLVDRLPGTMLAASRHNEGKIHLGYVYAHDISGRTAARMVSGALEFAPLLRRWLGADLPASAVASPFDYLVHRDSMLDVDQVAAHLDRCRRLLTDGLDGRRADYFGFDPTRPSRRLPDDDRYDARSVAAAYATEETAVDPVQLSAAVTARIEADPHITLRMSTDVRSVQPDHDGADVGLSDGSTTRYDHVVNALWAGRLAVDRTAGLEPDRPWWYRVKYFLRCTPRVELPSATVVLGPFGDIVRYADGGTFLSWYPVGRLGSSSELVPPDWPSTLTGPDAHAVIDGTLDGLRGLVPRLGSLTDSDLAGVVVGGGVIVAHGSSDIDDPGSALHERHDIGPRTLGSGGRYHSVDTGKLTMAPRHARMVVERILAIGATS